jgi:hypothetical protein
MSKEKESEKEKEKESEYSQKEYKVAKSYIDIFALNVVGARPNDTLIGSRPATKNAIIVINGTIKPYKKDVMKIKAFPSLWHEFKTKLLSIPFFKSIKDTEKETGITIDKWFDKNCADKDLFISDYPVKIEVVQLGAILDKIPDKDSANSVTSGLCTAGDIEKLIPGKPGSRARRHTLVMKTDFWKVNIEYSVGSSAKVGHTIDLVKDLESEGSVGHLESEKLVIKQFIGSLDFAIVVPKHRPTITREIVMGLLNEYSINKDQYIFFEHAMRDLTPASYKSLIQKLIRFQSKFVRFNDSRDEANDDQEMISTRNMLIMSIIKLAIEPGAFVPDIQRYVTGLESVTKRLAVTIIEDSYGDPEDIYHLLVCALVSQRIKWQVGPELLRHWIKIALKALESSRKFVYDWKKELGTSQMKFKDSLSTLGKCSVILEILKSFESDLLMLRNIARNNGSFVENSYQRPEFMEFEHFVDQHWIPNIAYFRILVPSFKEPEKIVYSKQFEPFFKHLWISSSSLNPRNDPNFHDKIASISFQEIKNIQKLVLFAKQSQRMKKRKLFVSRTGTESSKLSVEKISVGLSDGWLSALVGPIQVSVDGKQCYVTMRSDNNDLRENFVAIKVPSREMDDKPLSEEQQEIAIEKALEILKDTGVPLNKATVPYEALRDCILKLHGSEYIIINKKGSKVPWTTKLNLEFPLLKKIDYKSLESAVIAAYSTNGSGAGLDSGISKDHEKLLKKLLTRTQSAENGPRIIKRIVMYLSKFGSEFEINKVSMDGSGTYQMTTLEDSAVYLFLLELSLIYPAAIKPKGLGTFVSSCPPLLWKLTEGIRAYCGHGNTKDNKEVWPVKIEDQRSRKLWPHQTFILDEMKEKTYSRHGHFIWLKVGMGKTLIVMSYIKWLNDRGELPKYIVYTCPKSALKSVISEILAFGLSISLLVPIKNVPDEYRELSEKYRAKGSVGISINTKVDPAPYTVNLVTSDNHLRLASEALIEKAPNSLFIIDEVHKALNETQRTSVATELSSLSEKFIAFTGTPIIDSHTYKLIWWLEKIVPFEVNEKNFWTAANSMIAKIADTGIPTEHIQVLAKLKDPDYFSLVPPVLGGTNFNATISDLKKATDISYKTCTDKMIKLTIEHIDQGVMLVAKDKEHQDTLYKKLVKKVNPEKVLKMVDSVNLDFSDTSPVKVVIVPINKSEGYNLTKLSMMITCVYPSNQATRTQIEGRINRIGQVAEKLKYITVHCGTLTRILTDHNTAKNLNNALEAMHKQ